MTIRRSRAPRTGALALTLLVVLAPGRWGAASGAPPGARLQEREERAWTGAWLVDGGTAARYLWSAELGGLVLAGDLPEVGRTRLSGPRPAPGRPVVLRGRLPDGGGLRGALGGDGGRRGGRVTLTARPRPRGGLAVTVAVDEAVVARERWRRPGRPRLEIADLRPRRGGGFSLEVRVRGRPQPVVVEVRARAGDARYAHLGGVIHHEALADREPLPVGRYRVTWDGRDRSFAGEPVEPGAYRVVVSAGASGVAPPPTAAEPPGDARTWTAR